MENRLKRLFDYQLFEKNERIDIMMEKAERFSGLKKVDETELDNVSAAGAGYVGSTEQLLSVSKAVSEKNIDYKY